MKQGSLFSDLIHCDIMWQNEEVKYSPLQFIQKQIDTTSILCSEIYAFDDACDHTHMMKYDLQGIFGRYVPLQMLTDSNCLLDTITKS